MLLGQTDFGNCWEWQVSAAESQRRPDSGQKPPHSQGQTGDNRGGKAGSSPGKTWKHQSKRGDDLLVILAAQSEADDPRDQKETK